MDEILEGARDGRTVAELISFGSTVLDGDDVLPGVPALMPMIQVEGSFPDGTKLVTVHDPIRPGRATSEAPAALPEEKPTYLPGEIIAGEGRIEINAGRRTVSLRAVNTGDRPVQVGSHFHFFEANRALRFEREKAYGMRLDIAAGTAVRFEPGEERDVTLVAFGGTGEVHGLNGLTNGPTFNDQGLAAALQRARDAGFQGA